MRTSRLATLLACPRRPPSATIPAIVLGVAVLAAAANLAAAVGSGGGQAALGAVVMGLAAAASGRALRSRLRVADSPALWLPEKGDVPLSPNGVKLMLRRRGELAGVPDVHAHRWRHNFAHEWKLAGGDIGDLMVVLGWASDDMPRRYGASAAAERAQQVHARLRIGERV